MNILLRNFKENVKCDKWKNLATELKFKIYDFIVKFNIEDWETDI